MVPSQRQARLLARGLGWFSIALGVTELVAGRALARAVGLPGREALVRSYGLREIATGVGLLATAQTAPFLWARVGGDLLDLAALADGLATRQRTGAGVAVAAVAGVAVLDVACAISLSRPPAAPTVDYSSRSGFPRSLAAVKGIARRDFEAPRDMRIPPALRPWGTGAPAVDTYAAQGDMARPHGATVMRVPPRATAPAG